MREFDFQGRNPNNHPSGGTPGTVVVTGSINLHRQFKTASGPRESLRPSMGHAASLIVTAGEE